MAKSGKKQKKRGPKPEMLKIKGIKWQDAVTKALKRKRPEKGWPKEENR